MTHGTSIRLLPSNAGPSSSPIAREQVRFEQREAEMVTEDFYLPKVLHRGDAQMPPLLRYPSGAMYAVGMHRGSANVTLIRVDRKPKSKKLRREMKRQAKARAAAEAQSGAGA